MDARNLLKKYYSRLSKEGIIKALMMGLAVGFAVLLVTSLIWWIVGIQGLWLCAIFFVAATAATTPIFYFKMYRPTVKQAARRVDALGLEERLLTMTEFENETSFIAIKQREDAMFALKKVNEKLIKFAISISLIVTLAVTSVFGIGMVTVAALTEFDSLGGGAEGNQFKISYKVQGEGVLEGQLTQFVNRNDEIEYYQIVASGENAVAVLAVPADEWIFSGWSDGDGNPYRLDTVIFKNITLYAVFERVPDLEEEFDSDTIFDDAGFVDRTEPVEVPPGEQPPDPGSSQYEAYNKIIDGEIYYGSMYDDLAANAKNNAAERGDSSGIVDEYFKLIQK